MSLTLATPPAAEPISTAEAKLFLRVDGTADDTLIGSLVVAARQYAETKTRRQLVTATYRYSFDDFPDVPVIYLPRPPVQSVTSIQYYNTDDVLTTLNANSYLLDKDSEPARVTLAPSVLSVWPSTKANRPNAIQITYVAGYGNAASVPDKIKQAMYLIIGHLYENRKGVVTGTIATKLPMGVDALLAASSFGWYG